MKTATLFGIVSIALCTFTGCTADVVEAEMETIDHPEAAVDGTDEDSDAATVGNDESENVGTAEQALSLCASSPSAANCDGLDPVTAGCDADAVTIQSYGISGWPYWDFVDQRYSNKCKSRWTRYGANGWNRDTTVKITRISPSKTLTWRHDGTLNYTDMVYCPRSTCGAKSAVTTNDNSTTITMAIAY